MLGLTLYIIAEPFRTKSKWSTGAVFLSLIAAIAASGVVTYLASGNESLLSFLKPW